MATDFRSGFVSIIGRPNVGKSTLLNRILGQKIAITSRKPQTTRNRILGVHNFAGGQALFVDTPGIHQARSKLNRFMVDQALDACSDCDIILYLVAATDFRKAAEEPLLQRFRQHKTPVILIINKIDLLKPEQLLAQIRAYNDSFPFRHIIPLSAKTGNGVEQLLQSIEPDLPVGPRYYPQEVLTDQPERFVVAELIREKVMRRSGEEVPYGVAVQVETFEERQDRALVAIRACIHVEREGQKKIIIGKGGQMIKQIGRDARLEIEKLLGIKVFLELFVRVDKDWSQSERMLRELGYS